jgi:carboxyl-terminal processing protease
MKQFIWGAVFGASSVLAVEAMAAITPETAKALDRFAEALERTQANYIEAPGIDDLVDKAIDGMVSRLDPHSSYMDAKSFSALQSPGPRAGIGLELTQDFGMMKVVSPIDGTPAAAAGIQPGDALLAIDGESVVGMTLNQVIDRLRGPVASQLSLAIRRAPADAPQTITLTRAIISVPAVKFERKGDIAYIRFSGLSEGTTDQLHAVLRSLQKQIGPKLKGYIIDLRNNPGGLLDEAIRVSDEFLSSGNIVSTRGRHTQDTQRYDAVGGGLFASGDTADGKPVIILVNQGTAAGAEIIAAALQDHKRATILGMRTFGSGTIQTLIPLGKDYNSGNGVLRLTTAKFYRPSGAALQLAGVTPDILVAQSVKDGELDNWPRPSEAQLPGHLSGEAAQAGPASIMRPEPGKQYDDFQLATAIERLNALPTAKP